MGVEGDFASAAILPLFHTVKIGMVLNCWAGPISESLVGQGPKDLEASFPKPQMGGSSPPQGRIWKALP